MAETVFLDERGAFSGPITLRLVPGASVEHVAVGRLLYVDDADGEITLDAPRVRVTLKKGRLIRLPFAIERMRLVNDSAATVNMVLLIGNVSIEDHGDIEITQPNATTTVADVAVAAVAIATLPINLLRKHGSIRNTGAANIRLGDAANVAAGRGYQLRPGEFYTHDGTDALYAIRETGVSSTVCVIDHVRS